MADSTSKPKRPDLQCIRAIAILAVLLFHLFPEWFPNGFIGVDQFFVLSGYLIAMILNSKKLDTSTVFLFYYRRVKRIVPLYLLVALLILIASFTVLPLSSIDVNISSAWDALLFKTNLAGVYKHKDYAVMLQLAVDAFTHTWSLAVEMQFYLLVPIIFFILNKSSIYSIASICYASFFYSMIADPNTSFNSVFCRLWQFCFGIGSFMISKYSATSLKIDDVIVVGDENDENKALLDDYEKEIGKLENKNSNLTLVSYMVLAATLLQSFYVFPIPSTILRPNITILTGALIVLGSTKVIWPLSNKILAYGGDISYALYLIHWPIYTYAKLIHGGSIPALFVALLTSILAAILITETFEKFYLKLEKRGIFSLIVIMYVFCFVILLNSNTISEKLESLETIPDMYGNISRADAIKLNNRWAHKDLKQLRSFRCVFENESCTFESRHPNPSGPSVLLLGNSYAANVAGAFNETCGRNSSKIKLHWRSFCEPLLSYKIPIVNCSGAPDEYLETVRREKPDVVFLLVRHVQMMTPLQPNISTVDDPLYKEALSRLQKYESLVNRKIYILDAMPRPLLQTVRLINRGLQNDKMPKMEDLQDKEADFMAAKQRLRELVKNCQKCEMIDYSQQLSIDNDYQYYQKSNGLSFFTFGLHLTPLGLERIKPTFKDVCETF